MSVEAAGERERESLASAAAGGALWSSAAVYLGKLLVFASTLVLARLLDVEDFGLAGYAIVAIAFLDITQDLGIGSALIYARDDPRSQSTAFWLGLASGCALFAFSSVAAYWVGLFFDEPRAVALTRVLALGFPLAALGGVHSALLRKRLQFRRRFVPELARSLAKGGASIALALAGFGAWSLVLGQLAGAAASVVALWWVVPWRPRLEFDAGIAADLLGYGWKVAAVDALAVVLNKADNLFVGRFLGTASLGIYTLAFRIPELLVKQFAQVAGQVLFPVFARMRDEPERMREALLRALRMLALVALPVAVGLAVVADPLVRLLFSAKWIAAAPVVAVIALYTGVRALTLNLGAVYKAQGRPEILLRLSLLQLLPTLAVLAWAAREGGSVIAVAGAQLGLALAFRMPALRGGRSVARDLGVAVGGRSGAGAALCAGDGGGSPGCADDRRIRRRIRLAYAAALSGGSARSRRVRSGSVAAGAKRSRCPARGAAPPRGSTRKARGILSDERARARLSRACSAAARRRDRGRSAPRWLRCLPRRDARALASRAREPRAAGAAFA